MCKNSKQRVQLSIPPDSRLAGAIDDRTPSRAADNPRDENDNCDKVQDKIVRFTPYGRHCQLFACDSTITFGPYVRVVLG